MVFNYVVDWALSELDPDIGVRIAGQLCQYSAFVDDVVLFAPSREALKWQVELTVAALRKSRLSVNPAKCATMAIVADMRCKLWFVDTDPVVAVDGEWFRSCSQGYLQVSGLAGVSRGCQGSSRDQVERAAKRDN